MSPFSTHVPDTVASLGEERLIREIRRWLGKASPSEPFGIGDDCAVIPAGGTGRPQLVTVDPVIHGRHFDDSIPAKSAGAKLFKRNLSDIAAMGGTPRAAVVALAMEKSVSISWLRDFYKGLAAVSLRYGVPVVGGDVAQVPSGFVATLTLLGEASGPRVLTRKGARQGDLIYVTGKLGDSLATGHHHRFAPRLEEGCWLAGRAEVLSMMDISDGLAKDLQALTPAGALPLVHPEGLPRRNGCDLRAALCAGEDYELVFCVKADAKKAAFETAFKRKFPRTPLSCIGHFGRSEEAGEHLISPAGFHGFEHLKA